MIGRETGRYVTGDHGSPRSMEVTPEILLGRNYFISRAIEDSELCSCPRCPSLYLIGRQAEKGTNAQTRFVKEFHAAVIDTPPNWTSGGTLQGIYL